MRNGYDLFCYRRPLRKHNSRWFIHILILLTVVLGLGLYCSGCGFIIKSLEGSTSNLIYPQTSITIAVGQAITPDIPTVTGTFTSYAVSPALPAGLALDSSTGAISGTPTAVVSQATYTVTASNSAGTTSASITITVNATLAPPSSLVYSLTSITATVGQAITPDIPSVTGTVTSYTVSPTLPAGLGLNSSTGAISGTPTTVAPQATYTVTASNAAGSTSASIRITVNATLAPPSSLVYSLTSITAAVGQAITPDTPLVTGTVTSYTVSPALPAGLVLNSSTGAISGTPTAVVPQATYTVTASNSAGSTSARIAITVNAAPAQPSNLVYPQTSITAMVSQAITPDTPTVTGTVASYAVSPALPAGLALNSSTGAISGTPTTVAPQATYAVTASNSAGSTSASITITVNTAPAPPSNLVYPQTSITAMVGQAITPDIPLVTGTVTSYAVSPALPAGLALNGSNGAISGTPTAAAPQATYTVTASNAGGSTTATIQITINAALNTLLDLGHAFTIQRLRAETSRVLSQDSSGHWALWDYASGAELASGDSIWPTSSAYGIRNWDAEMAGPTIVIGITSGLEVRSSSDGHLLSTIASSTIDSPQLPLNLNQWKLASDGSYICAISKNGLNIWEPTGQLLTSKPGDYSNAKIFAAPGQVLVALGPAGQNVVETISAMDGASVVGAPFSGQFNSWFLDGGHFLTNEANTVWIYSNTSVSQGIVALPTIENLTGQGNWFWTYAASSYPDYPLEIYAIGSSSPVATYNISDIAQVVASNTTIGVLPYGTAATSVIDLSGSTPSKSDYTLPVVSTSTFAAASGSQWLVANTHGVLLDGASLSSQPHYFGFGQAWSIAGSSSRAAIATAIGTILYFDPSTTTPEGTIQFSSGKLALSSDGTVLAAAAESFDAQYEPDRTLNIYSLPSESLISSFPYTFGATPTLLNFTLSTSGAALGQVLDSQEQVTGITGGPITWSQTGLTDPILLSPDGTLLAVSNVGLVDPPSSVTNIWRNGTLVTAIPGVAVGWIDNNQLLVNNYVFGGPKSAEVIYAGCTIYNSTGSQLATPHLPELHSIQIVTPDTIYSPDLNAIFSVTTGQATWTSPYPVRAGLNPQPGGAVSGSYVVFESGSHVFVDQY